MKKGEEKVLGEIIIPPRYAKIGGPVIFLAGPIRGVTNWQDEAIRYIRSKDPELNIASPRRLELIQEDFPEAVFEEQINWEHYYLQRASEDGVILFWLAREVDHRCDRAYAQTTRFELGEAVAMHRFAHIKVVVGIENGFTGGKYIRKTLAKKYPKISVCDSLDGTCELAIELAAR